MNENEYRATYHGLNKRRCIFEKALNSRVCGCQMASRFNLADREGVACKSSPGQVLCSELIRQLRQNARFALALTRINGPLPHSREIKVQNGGLLGLQRVLSPEHQDQRKVENVFGLVAQAIEAFDTLSSLPFDEIVQSVVAYEGRRRHSRKGL
jgi:hypothetical protein